MSQSGKTEIALPPPPAASGLKAAMKDIMSGTMGGVAQVLAGHPLDTVKVRLQTQKYIPGEAPQFAGMIDCFKKTVKGEGVLGLYKGAASPLTGAMAHNAALFFAYGQSKALLGAATRELSLAECYAAGMITGVLVSLVEGPIDLFKSKMQAQTAPKAGEKPQYTGVFDAARKIGARHGVRGVFQGLHVTAMRNGPAFGAYFCAFEATKRALTPVGEKPSLFVCFVAGGVAGGAFWGLLPNYPLDLIKSKMQTDASDPAERKYRGLADCISKTLKEEGWRGFFRGYLPCIVRAVPVNASIFLAVEATKRVISKGETRSSSGH